MSVISTEIIINTSLEKAWATLIDFDSYKEWNPFIVDIKGNAQLGEKLAITIYPPEKKKMTFKPKIISFINLQEFQWLGSLLAPGIFDGYHKFILHKLSDNEIKFVQSEQFTGILHKPIFNMIEKATKLGFEQMNLAFKQRCEI